jgi:hypothetical protein
VLLKVSRTLPSGSLDTLTAPANGSFTCKMTNIVAAIMNVSQSSGCTQALASKRRK